MIVVGVASDHGHGHSAGTERMGIMAEREGWSYGTTDGGVWLTILGSHHRAPILAPTPGDAVRPGVDWIQDRLILARVRETWHPGVASGRAYKILERGD